MSLLSRFTRGAVALLALSLGFVSTEVRAASVSYTGTFPLSPYLNGGTYNFAPVGFMKFDLVGQCLTSVCIVVDGGLNGQIAFENYQLFPVVVNVNFTGTITLKRPDSSPILTVQPLTTTSDNMPIFDGVLDYGGTSGKTYPNVLATKADSLCLTSASDLALFTGNGAIALLASATDLCSQVGASSWSIGPKAYANVTVTYNYRDCTVPAERQTWGRIKSNYR